MSPIPEIPYELIYGERTVRSVANATRQDGIDFLEIANKIQIKSTINIFNLNEANEALMAVKNSQINGEAVLKI
jgi:propanol-preferring alcohol dehydrogenase